MKALIIGGTKGFGGQVTEELSNKGFTSITVGRSGATYDCDIGDLESWKSVSKKIKEEHVEFDVVFFVVGYARAKTSENLTVEDWHEHLNKNLVYVSLALEYLESSFSDKTKIITIGSQWSYKVGNGDLVPYIVAKHALRTLTEDFAVRNPKLTANHYCMPTMDTPQYREVQKSYLEIGKKFPFTQYVESNEVARLLINHAISFKGSGATLMINNDGSVKDI